LRVGLAEGGDNVAKLVDQVCDFLAAQAAFGSFLRGSELREGRRSFSLDSADPARDDCWVGTGVPRVASRS
jgi:hypothetical protein